MEVTFLACAYFLKGFYFQTDKKFYLFIRHSCRKNVSATGYSVEAKFFSLYIMYQIKGIGKGIIKFSIRNLK